MFILTSKGYINANAVTAILKNINGHADILLASGHNLALAEDFDEFFKKFFNEIDHDSKEFLDESDETPTIDEKPPSE